MIEQHSASIQALLAELERSSGRLIWDSAGLRLRYRRRSPLAPELVEELRARRGEILEWLEAEARSRVPAAAPLGTGTCADCGERCGTAARCARCAAARVRLAAGLHRCPRCSRVTHHATEPCLACMAVQLGARRD